MPDQAKLAALEAAGYKINNSCGACRHGRFAFATAWGTCDLITYQHARHTDPRKASIHSSGKCPRFDARPSALELIGRSGFQRFLPRAGGGAACGTANRPEETRSGGEQAGASRVSQED